MIYSAYNWLVDRLVVRQPRLRRAITYVTAGNSDRQVEICGTKLTINTLKENGYLRAWKFTNRSSLLRDELAVITNLLIILKENDTFVDVGANVGVFSRTMLRIKKCFPTFRVYAFEANPDTYKRLVLPTTPGFDARQMAVSNSAGELIFVGGAVSHVFTTEQNANFYSIKSERTVVPTCRLDQAGIEGDSIVIKVDVEGQELSVLQGAAGLLDAKRVKAVFFDGFPNADLLKQAMDLLRGYGFRFFDGRTLESKEEGAFALLALQPGAVPGLAN